MNKAFASILLAAAMIVPGVSLATSCGVIACENGNPENVVSVWGYTNAGLPHVLPGHYAADGKSLCPRFITTYCVDITGTAYYKALYR